jgi:hypothetical protein
MAITNYTDFVLDNQYFHTGVGEAVTQNLQLFNELSQGAIQLENKQIPGHFHDNIFYQSMEDAWNRRDITASTAISSADTTKVVELDQRGVKFNAKMYVPFTRHAFQKNFDPDMKGDYQAISRRIGMMTGNARLKQQINHAIYSVAAAVKTPAASLRTNLVSSANYLGKANSQDLNETRALMGDMAGRLVCWVMHSKAYFNLVGTQIGDKLFGVTEMNLYKGVPATFNLPTLVTDSLGLVNVVAGTGGYTQYYTLGLVEGAVKVINSEPEAMFAQPKTGNENITIDLQGEGAHNIEVKGFQWDQGNGGLNPTVAALATGSNWDIVSANVKNRAGVVMASR